MLAAFLKSAITKFSSSSKSRETARACAMFTYFLSSLFKGLFSLEVHASTASTLIDHEESHDADCADNGEDDDGNLELFLTKLLEF